MSFSFGNLLFVNSANNDVSDVNSQKFKIKGLNGYYEIGLLDPSLLLALDPSNSDYLSKLPEMHPLRRSFLQSDQYYNSKRNLIAEPIALNISGLRYESITLQNAVMHSDTFASNRIISTSGQSEMMALGREMINSMHYESIKVYVAMNSIHTQLNDLLYQFVSEHANTIATNKDCSDVSSFGHKLLKPIMTIFNRSNVSSNEFHFGPRVFRECIVKYMALIIRHSVNFYFKSKDDELTIDEVYIRLRSITLKPVAIYAYIIKYALLSDDQSLSEYLNLIFSSSDVEIKSLSDIKLQMWLDKGFSNLTQLDDVTGTYLLNGIQHQIKLITNQAFPDLNVNDAFMLEKIVKLNSDCMILMSTSAVSESNSIIRVISDGRVRLVRLHHHILNNHLLNGIRELIYIVSRHVLFGGADRIIILYPDVYSIICKVPIALYSESISRDVTSYFNPVFGILDDYYYLIDFNNINVNNTERIPKYDQLSIYLKQVINDLGLNLLNLVDDDKLLRKILSNCQDTIINILT